MVQIPNKILEGEKILSFYDNPGEIGIINRLLSNSFVAKRYVNQWKMDFFCSNKLE